jgi:hypothetical protein
MFEEVDDFTGNCFSHARNCLQPGNAFLLHNFLQRCGPYLDCFRRVTIGTKTKGIVATDFHQRGQLMEALGYGFVIHSLRTTNSLSA